MSRIPSFHLLKSTFFIQLLVISVIFVTLYGVVQYNLRAAANDPQVQMSQDGARNLVNGMTPQGIVGSTVPIEKSLSAFTIVYYHDGTVAATSATLNNEPPKLPIGVLKATSEKKPHTITWEPKQGVRIATAVTATPNYYVVVGRNIAEVEKREQTSLLIVLAGWMITIVILYLAKKR